MRTFDKAFAEHHLTKEEREAMVWHLAMYRARKTVAALLPGPTIEAQMLAVLRDSMQ